MEVNLEEHNIIEDCVNGLLVEPEDQDGLTRQISLLLSDDDLRGRLAANARATIEARYSFVHRMKHVASIYDDLSLERRPGRRWQCAVNGRLARVPQN